MAAAPPEPTPTVELRPIIGERIDPPPPSSAAVLDRIEDRSHVAGLGYRAFHRFVHSRVTLLAAGTSYYLFLAVFAMATLGYGVAAQFQADRLAQSITAGLSEAFPGLIGENGIEPEALRQAGQATSLFGAVLMLYSGSGAMYATSRSLHTIYGAPKDPRNFVIARIRLLGWLLVLAPLALASYVTSTAVAGYLDAFLESLGIDLSGPGLVLTGVSLAVSLLLNFVIVYLLLGHLGGIRPPRKPRMIGAVVGAIGIEVLKYGMTYVIAYSISKPQYGAFAAPISLMLVLYLQVMTVYLSASLVAGLSEEPDLIDSVSLGAQPDEIVSLGAQPDEIADAQPGEHADARAQPPGAEQATQTKKPDAQQESVD